MHKMVSDLLDRKKALGLTQDQLADLSGLSQNLISLIENGHENITLGTYSKLAEALSAEEERRANGSPKRRKSNGKRVPAA